MIYAVNSFAQENNHRSKEDWNNDTEVSYDATANDTIGIKRSFWGIQLTRGEGRINLRGAQLLAKDNEEAYRLLRAARTHNVFSGIFGGIGGFCIGWSLGRMIATNEASVPMVITGLAAISASIPFSVLTTKKTLEGVRAYNEGLGKVSANKRRVEYSLAANGKTVGLLVQF